MTRTRTADTPIAWSLTAWLAVGMSVYTAAQAQNPRPDGDAKPDDTLVVRMVDGIDSDSDAAAREYRAVVTQDVERNGVAIGKGSAAKVIVVKTQSGLVTQLASVNVNGVDTVVTSSSASVNGLVPGGAVGGAVNAVTSVFSGFGRKKTNAATPEAAASGPRVKLFPGTEVRFQLGPAAPAAVQPSARGAAPAPDDGRRSRVR